MSHFYFLSLKVARFRKLENNGFPIFWLAVWTVKKELDTETPNMPQYPALALSFSGKAELKASLILTTNGHRTKYPS